MLYACFLQFIHESSYSFEDSLLDRGVCVCKPSLVFWMKTARLPGPSNFLLALPIGLRAVIQCYPPAPESRAPARPALVFALHLCYFDFHIRTLPQHPSSIQP